MPKALILRQPCGPDSPDWLRAHIQAADVMEGMLGEAGFEVEVTQTLDRLLDGTSLRRLDLIVPVWEWATITPEQLQPLLQAVREGTGVGGVHGTMADSFRDATEYQFMAGGQFVAHPGGGEVSYRVHIEDLPSPITEGLQDFTVTSEQYYLHVDPGNCVLATTCFGEVVMPVTWTRSYGRGRVFYCSVGHDRATLEIPEVHTMVSRGLSWAAAGRRNT